MVLLFSTTYISVDLAHHELFWAQVGKGGINVHKTLFSVDCVSECAPPKRVRQTSNEKK